MLAQCCVSCAPSYLPQPRLLTVAPTTEFSLKKKCWKRHALHRNVTILRDSLWNKVVNMRIKNMVHSIIRQQKNLGEHSDLGLKRIIPDIINV